MINPPPIRLKYSCKPEFITKFLSGLRIHEMRPRLPNLSSGVAGRMLVVEGLTRGEEPWPDRCESPKCSTSSATTPINPLRADERLGEAAPLTMAAAGYIPFQFLSRASDSASPPSAGSFHSTSIQCKSGKSYLLWIINDQRTRSSSNTECN